MKMEKNNNSATKTKSKKAAKEETKKVEKVAKEETKTAEKEQAKKIKKDVKTVEKTTKGEAKKVEKDVTTEVETKSSHGNYITGTVGLIIGGLIATIPWILVYVYGNMMFSVLSIFIATGEFYGYKLFNGKMSKKLPILIMIMSIIIVALTTLIIIPAFLIMKEGVTVSVSSLENLYASETFTSAIMKDAAVAVAFTILGSSVVTANIKRKIAAGNIQDIDLNNSMEIDEIKKDAITVIKPIFEKFNALTKDHGILKDEINAELNEDETLKTKFNVLKTYKIVKKSNGRFYYDEQAENNQLQPKSKKHTNLITTLIGLILVAIIVGVVILNQMGIINKKVISDNHISFEVNGKWIEYDSFYKNTWNFYRYINSVEPSTDEEIDENDYSKWPASLSISYSNIDTEQASSIQEIQTGIKENINELEIKPSVYEDEITKTKNGYDLLTVKLTFDQNPNQIEFLNYILNQDELAIIDVNSVNLQDESELKKVTDMIAQSFKWEE